MQYRIVYLVMNRFSPFQLGECEVFQRPWFEIAGAIAFKVFDRFCPLLLADSSETPRVSSGLYIATVCRQGEAARQSLPPLATLFFFTHSYPLPCQPCSTNKHLRVVFFQQNPV